MIDHGISRARQSSGPLMAEDVIAQANIRYDRQAPNLPEWFDPAPPGFDKEGVKDRDLDAAVWAWINRPKDVLVIGSRSAGHAVSMEPWANYHGRPCPRDRLIFGLTQRHSRHG